METKLYLDRLLELINYKDQKDSYAKEQKWSEAAGFRELEREVLKSLNMEHPISRQDILSMIKDARIKLYLEYT